jgi:PAS domain S-box-containing protein
LIAADGRAVWVRDLVTVQAHEDGTLTFRGVTLDVSHWHRESDNRHAHMERRAQVMFNAAAIGMALVDLDARLLETNPAFQRMLGYSSDELRSLTIPQITHPDDVDRDAALYTEVLSGERDHYELEKRLLHKDGAAVWVKLTASLVRDASGRPEYGVGMVEDITDRKELEAKLLHTRKMEAVGRLAGGIAHDFNNLLTVIRGYSDFLMLGRSPDDAVRHDAEEIRLAADRAALLIQHLLAFSRKQQLFPVVLDVNDTVLEVATMLERVIGEHVALVTRLGGQAGRILADRGQLQQVLVNLALNARDAMPLGGTVVIETRRTRVERGDGRGVPAGEYVSLSITDTGRGISEDILPRIFEPFFTTKDVGHGTGLGLATAYGIVEQSGGHLTVTSTPGHGATFTVLLPPVGEGHPEPVHVREQPRALGGGETVLVVDDDESVRRLTQQTLERGGYRVLVARGGPEALEIAREHGTQINLVITDVMMPAMTGPEFVRRLGTLSTAGVPILYVSGFADAALFQRSALRSGEQFLAKPFPPADLEAKVREMLDAER